jgi:hypothetical protein
MAKRNRALVGLERSAANFHFHCSVPLLSENQFLLLLVMLAI